MDDLRGNGNFSFLAEYIPKLARLGALAEKYFHETPANMLIILRRFGEFVTEAIAGSQALLPPRGISFDKTFQSIKQEANRGLKARTA